MKLEKIEGKDGFFLEVDEKEYKKLEPFLNRYGFLDRFPQSDYPNGYPVAVTVFKWMFPESIKVICKEETKNEGH